MVHNHERQTWCLAIGHLFEQKKKNEIHTNVNKRTRFENHASRKLRVLYNI